MLCHRNLLGIALASMLAGAVFALPAGAHASGTAAPLALVVR